MYGTATDIHVFTSSNCANETNFHSLNTSNSMIENNQKGLDKKVQFQVCKDPCLFRLEFSYRKFVQAVFCREINPKQTADQHCQKNEDDKRCIHGVGRAEQ